MEERIESFVKTYLGRDYDDYDCWDIVKFFYRDVLRVDLNFVDNYGVPGNDNKYREKVANIVELHKEKFKEVEVPVLGDIILFNIYGVSAHVGVYLNNRKFIHSMRDNGCTVDSLHLWKNKVEGFYRWPEQD